MSQGRYAEKNVTFCVRNGEEEQKSYALALFCHQSGYFCKNLQSKCFFFGPIISSVVALQTDFASPWPARLCLAASSLSFMVCPAMIAAAIASHEYFFFAVLPFQNYHTMESTRNQTELGTKTTLIQLLMHNRHALFIVASILGPLVPVIFLHNKKDEVSRSPKFSIEKVTVTHNFIHNSRKTRTLSGALR